MVGQLEKSLIPEITKRWSDLSVVDFVISRRVVQEEIKSYPAAIFRRRGRHGRHIQHRASSKSARQHC